MRRMQSRVEMVPALLCRLGYRIVLYLSIISFLYQ